MNVLTVVYSRTGLTEQAVFVLRKALAADGRLIQIRTDKRIGFLKGALLAIRKKGCKISAVSPAPDLGAYDLVIVAAPIWASCAAAPIREFLMNFKGAKKLAVILTHSSKDTYPKAVEDIENLAGIKACAVLDLCSIESGETADKVKSFAKTLLQ